MRMPDPIPPSLDLASDSILKFGLYHTHTYTVILKNSSTIKYVIRTQGNTEKYSPKLNIFQPIAVKQAVVMEIKNAPV